jgi:hypothetical protein
MPAPHRLAPADALALIEGAKTNPLSISKLREKVLRAAPASRGG